MMKRYKPRSYSAKLWKEWPLESLRSIKNSYKRKSVSVETQEDIYESHFTEESDITDFDFNVEETNDKEFMNQTYYNEFLPSGEPQYVTIEPDEEEDLIKLASKVVEMSKKYCNHGHEPSWNKMGAIIVSVMFKNNILPSMIPTEPEFDIKTVKRNSLRYFSTSGMAEFTCPNGHSWKYWGNCYMDFRMKRICYRYTKRCVVCKTPGIPSFSETTFWKMAKSAVWLYLHRTGTSPKRDTVFFMSRMWYEQPSEREPEPSNIEIQNLILAAMTEQNISPSQIPNERSFDIAAVTMDSLRYFSMKTFAWFECEKEHKWSSIHSWCFVDLKEQQIAYRYELPCPSCRARVKMSLTSDSIRNMATKVVEKFLANKMRRERRHCRDKQAQDIDSTSNRDSVFKRGSDDCVEEDNNQTRTFKSIVFKTAATKVKKQRFVKKLPEPVTSEEDIKEIILTKMKEDCLIPSDIPHERKFNICKALPWSLRYYRTKGFAILRCDFCKISTNAVMVCYLDLLDRTICHRFRKSCTLCGNLMETNYCRSSIERMAVYATEQYNILTE